ncbi:MAG: hypothetical protein RBT74_10810 [Tenuifilaceae bacterium]|jgi:hypothetical protein|nr:hypothetical protein [Tenuifilaceae bacterium]
MTFQDQQILQKILAQDVAIGSVFSLFIRQVTPLLERYNYGSKELWVKNGLVEQRIDREVERLSENLKNVVVGNQKWAWNLANAKNDNLVERYIKGLALPGVEGLFAANLRALDQFINRKTNGLNVSENIWRTSKQAKTQLEYYLQSGIAEGRSAATISRDIRQLLDDPDTLFRRVRDKNGNLVPSKPMKGYNPGQGRYRSAYKNALRLSATEINMAYRSSDHERWQGLDFVVGIEIKLSTAHPREDICDHMKGRYPKDFKFTGWHPFCICFAVPILMPQEDFMNYIEGDDDTRMAIFQRNRVQSIPYSANQYLDKHQQSIDGWKKPPIWVKDNFVGDKIGNGLKVNIPNIRSKIVGKQLVIFSGSLEEFANKIFSTLRTTNEVTKVGTLDKIIVADLAIKDFVTKTNEVFISDKKILKYKDHPKDTKGAVLDVNSIEEIKRAINSPLYIYEDLKSKAIIYIYVTDYKDKYLKVVIHPNYNLSGNYINLIKSIGVVDKDKMSNAKQYRRIK